MKQQTKTLLLAGILVVIVAAAGIAYRVLMPQAEPELPVVQASRSAPEESTPEDKNLPEDESTQGEEEITRIEAPDFTFYDGDGQALKLSDFKGRPLVLNFWASWCGPCKNEMPDFDKVCAELGDEVGFLMIDLVDGAQETVEKGKAFIEKQGFTFPVYFDTDQDGAYTYGVRSIPTTLFIDAEGYAVTGAQGMITEEQLRFGISMITE